MTVKAFARFWPDRRGAGALEFALIATPLVLMLLGSLEFGRARWTQQAINETAIDGARCMGVRQTQCSQSGTYDATKAMSYVQALGTSWGLTIPTSGITLDNAATCNGVTGFSRVTISYTFESVIPASMIALFQKVPVTGDACFPNQPTS